MILRAVDLGNLCPTRSPRIFVEKCSLFVHLQNRSLPEFHMTHLRKKLVRSNSLGVFKQGAFWSLKTLGLSHDFYEAGPELMVIHGVEFRGRYKWPYKWVTGVVISPL